MPKPKFQLNKNEIHIWTAKTQNSYPDSLLTRYAALLTESETSKQQRYIFKSDQHDALITRAFIRDLLAHYSGIAPQDLRFSKGAHGKPELINTALPIRFNLSHTKGMVICAVTLKHDIGCDIENLNRNSKVLEIAERFFSKQETNALFKLPKEQQRDRFFDYWTLKESYIKAWGQGLAIPLKEFSFEIGTQNKTKYDNKKYNSNIKLNFDEKRNDEPTHWKSWLFYPSNEHRVALSIRNPLIDINTNYKFRYFESTPLICANEKKNL